MPRLFAFLRAINVGGHVVRMEQLRALFGELGFSNVETFITSGNVVFETRAASIAALEARIEKHLAKALGYEVATFVRSAVELSAILRGVPFTPAEVAEAHALYVAFLQAPVAAEVRQRLASAPKDTDVLHVEGREIYWLSKVRFSDSAFSGPRLEKTLGAPVTVRNTSTLRKLEARYATEGS